MNNIQMYLKGKDWFAAIMTNGQPDSEAIRLFGTHHILTAYTWKMPFADVHEKMQHAWPGYTITLS